SRSTPPTPTTTPLRSRPPARHSVKPDDLARPIGLCCNAMNVASASTVSYDEAAEQRHLALRSEFLLDPDVTFLNHGAFGACPRPVFEKYQWWQRELERQPVEFLGRRLSGLMENARQGLATYLNADADEIVYFSNVT